MLNANNFGRCVAVKLGAEKVAIFPAGVADLSADPQGGSGDFASPPPPFKSQAARTGSIRPTPSLWSRIYEWGTRPIGTAAYAQQNNLTHLPPQEQAQAYREHQYKVFEDARKKGQLPEQIFNRHVDNLVSFVNDPDTRVRTMAALGGSMLPSWAAGPEAQQKQIDAAAVINSDDVQLQTELFNQTPIAKTVLAGGEAAQSAYMAARDAVSDEVRQIGDDLSTPGGTILGSIDQSARRIGERIDQSARRIGERTGLDQIDYDPRSWGRRTRAALAEWWKRQTATAQRRSTPPPPLNLWGDVRRNMADTGKKLQELMRDPKYAPMIAAPLLGLGAYGIYDSFRNKKRGKRPKFYDENAREF